MAACSQPLNCFQIKEWAACVPSRGRFHVSEKLGCPTIRRSSRGSRLDPCGLCLRETVAFPSNELTKIDATLSGEPFDVQAVLKGFKMNLPDSSSSHAVLDSMQGLVVADLDPASAKIAIAFLGPFLSAFSFLFILRIVMSWYPKLPVGKFPYVIAYAPTEPLLIPTRKVIPPLGGVDVTPVVWFGLVSFLNEILVGPQGLLVLLSQQVS